MTMNPKFYHPLNGKLVSQEEYYIMAAIKNGFSDFLVSIEQSFQSVLPGIFQGFLSNPEITNVIVDLIDR